MNASLWAEIAAAYEDCMRAVEAAFAVPGGAPDLDALRGRLWRRLDAVRTRLERDLKLDPDDALRRWLAPLLFLIDEKVELRLARAGGDDFPDWQQLQAILMEVNGGDAFYERARELPPRRYEIPRPVDLADLAGLYLFCLEAGFQGRHFDNPDAIRQLQEDLAACIDVTPDLSRATKGTASSPAPRSIPTSRYALTAAGAVVALQVVLLAISRAM